MLCAYFPQSINTFVLYTLFFYCGKDRYLESSKYFFNLFRTWCMFEPVRASIKSQSEQLLGAVFFGWCWMKLFNEWRDSWLQEKLSTILRKIWSDSDWTFCLFTGRIRSFGTNNTFISIYFPTLFSVWHLGRTLHQNYDLNPCQTQQRKSQWWNTELSAN